MRPARDELADLIRAVARDELLPRFRHSRRSWKADGSIVTEADLAVQARMTDELQQRYPDIPLLGEEMEAGEQRDFLARNPDQYWCLDPLDGTSNFAAGLPFFSISLALMRGHEPVLGLVYDPNTDECYSAERGQGAWLNGEPLRTVDPSLPLRRCLAMVDFKRLGQPLATALVAKPPYSSLRYTHVYLHGEQKLWDFAAGALILDEAGGVATTLQGEPLFGAAHLARSVMAAATGGLFQDWRQAIAERMPA